MEIGPEYWNRRRGRRCGTPRRGNRRRRLGGWAASSGAPCDRDRRRARPNRIRRRKAPVTRCWRNARRKASTPGPRGTASLRCSPLPFSDSFSFFFFSASSLSLSLWKQREAKQTLNRYVDRFCCWIELKDEPNNRRKAFLLFYDMNMICCLVPCCCCV